MIQTQVRHTETFNSLHERVEAIRERHRRKAYEKELKGRGPTFLSSPYNLADSISKLSNIEGDEAEAAAQEIYRSADDVGALAEVLKGMPDEVLNYIYSSVCYRYFTKKYFPVLVERNFAPAYHDEYFKILRAVETHQTIYPALVCGPRDWGKSTLGSMILPIHAVIFPVELTYPNGKVVDLSKKFIMLVSAAQGASGRWLQSICAEFQENEDIRTDFGEFYRDPESTVKRNKTWSKIIAVTHNGKRLEAHTRRTKIKGANYRGSRPDLIIPDDMEDDENTENPNLRDRDFIWYNKIVVPARAKKNGNVLTLGNLDNPDGLCERIKKHAEEKGHLVKIFTVSHIDPVTNRKVYTWIEEFGPDWEAEQLEIIGDEAYELEYQSNAHAALRELALDEIGYYDPNLVKDNLKSMWLIGAVDQASGKKKARHDETAIGGIAYDKASRVTYVLPARIGKISKSIQPQAVLDYHCDYDFMEVHVEATSDQGALCVAVQDLAVEKDITINVEEIHGHTVNKHDRIAQRLLSRIKNHRILFIDGDKSHTKIIDQLIRLGQPGVKDDGADMLEMCVRARDKKLFGKKSEATAGGTIYAQTVNKEKSNVTKSVLTGGVGDDGNVSSIPAYVNTHSPRYGNN